MDSTRSEARKCEAPKSRAEGAATTYKGSTTEASVKVFYPAKRGSKTRQKTKPQVSVLMPGSAQRGGSRVKNRDFKIKMVVGDGFDEERST